MGGAVSVTEAERLRGLLDRCARQLESLAESAGAGDTSDVDALLGDIRAATHPYPYTSPHPRCKRPNCPEHLHPWDSCAMCARLRGEDEARMRGT